MIIDATEVGCTNKYDFSESIGPIKNQITPGSYDLNNFGGVQGIATSRAPFYGFGGTTTVYMRSAGTWGLTDTFTIEVIFSISATTGADQYICGDIVAGYATGGVLYYKNADSKIAFYSTAGTVAVTTAAAITLGKVYHVVVTYDKNAGANNTKIYVNGVYSNAATCAASPAPGLNFQVSHDSTLVRPLKGRVFFIRIFNRVLTPVEVAQNFEAERWRIPHTTHTWVAAPSVAATHTYARITNLEKQWEHLARDIGPIQATQIVATTTSLKKTGADLICDGTADDVEIQAAVDAAHAVGGGTVMILDGTYVLAASIKLYDNITLCGMGRATKLKRYGASSYAIENYDGNEGNAGVAIRDLTIIGNGGTAVADTLERGISLTNCIEFPYVSIQKVHFSDNVYGGVVLTDCQHVIIDGCSNVGRQAVGAGSFLIDCENSRFVQIVNCSALEYSGIYLYQSSDCMIKGCVVTTHAVTAYWLFQCTHCGIVGCSSSPDSVGSPFGGIEDYGGVQNLLTNNVIYKGTTGGIIADGDSVGCVVIGNVIQDPTGYGIYYGNRLGYANISFNNISNASKDGIRGPDISDVSINGGVINSNDVFYCTPNGIVTSGTLHTVVNYNTCVQNSHTDNTGANISIHDEGTAYNSDENLVSQNLCYKGDAAPQTALGIYIGGGMTNNMVTMNNLLTGGKTAALSDGGTTTDLKAWMVAGNKIA
jgi:hypothetical protein